MQEIWFAENTGLAEERKRKSQRTVSDCPLAFSVWSNYRRQQSAVKTEDNIKVP